MMCGGNRCNDKCYQSNGIWIFYYRFLESRTKFSFYLSASGVDHLRYTGRIFSWLIMYMYMFFFLLIQLVQCVTFNILYCKN